MKASISNRIYLSYSTELLDKLKPELTYHLPPPQPEAQPEVVCNVSCVGKRAITIPSGRTDLIPKNYEIIDKRVKKPYKFPDFVNGIELREDQKEIYDQVDSSCIINAKPGWGKTFTSLAIAAKLGMKTLIVVHNVALREQWEDQYRRMFGSSPGIIGSGTLNFDAPVVIANIQTLRKYGEKVAGMFGTVIIDEVHHCPASSFKNFIDKSKAYYKIGLSATLVRRDKKHVMLNDFFSNKRYTPPERNRMTPKVVMMDTGVELSSNRMIPWATKVNQISGVVSYREKVIGLANALVRKGRKILVLADRVEFIEYCSSLTENSSYVVGSTDNRKEILKRVYSDIDCLYGTTSIFKEGISVDILDCVILAFPVSHENLGMLEQIIGRITRFEEGKPNPLVIDMIFRGGTGKRQADGRYNYYINQGYKVVKVDKDASI